MKDQEERRRDMFIAAVLTGIAGSSRYDDWSDRGIADRAVRLASAVMARLDREVPKNEAN